MVSLKPPWFTAKVFNKATRAFGNGGSEVPVGQRAPVTAVHPPLAIGVVEGCWKQPPDDADHPVFALTRAG